MLLIFNCTEIDLNLVFNDIMCVFMAIQGTLSVLCTCLFHQEYRESFLLPLWLILRKLGYKYVASNNGATIHTIQRASFLSQDNRSSTTQRRSHA